MGDGHCLRDMVPFLGMVTVEATNVVLNVLFKSATSRGMSVYVFIVYSYAVATLILFPLLFIFNGFASLSPSFHHHIMQSLTVQLMSTFFCFFVFFFSIFAERDCFFPLSSSLSFVKYAALDSLGTEFLLTTCAYML